MKNVRLFLNKKLRTYICFPNFLELKCNPVDYWRSRLLFLSSKEQIDWLILFLEKKIGFFVQSPTRAKILVLFPEQNVQVFTFYWSFFLEKERKLTNRCASFLTKKATYPERKVGSMNCKYLAIFLRITRHFFNCVYLYFYFCHWRCRP